MFAVSYLSDGALSEIKTYISTDSERYSGLYVSANGSVSQDGDAPSSCHTDGM